MTADPLLRVGLKDEDNLLLSPLFCPSTDIDYPLFYSPYTQCQLLGTSVDREDCLTSLRLEVSSSCCSERRDVDSYSIQNGSLISSVFSTPQTSTLNHFPLRTHPLWTPALPVKLPPLPLHLLLPLLPYFINKSLKTNEKMATFPALPTHSCFIAQPFGPNKKRQAASNATIVR